MAALAPDAPAKKPKQTTIRGLFGSVKPKLSPRKEAAPQAAAASTFSTSPGGKKVRTALFQGDAGAGPSNTAEEISPPSTAAATSSQTPPGSTTGAADESAGDKPKSPG